MNSIASRFTIKDLENLSGIKAHTIRIWEKRYEILEPKRTDTNIRYYDTENLKKLLNVTLLYKGDHKISKIAKLNDKELNELVKDHLSKGGDDKGYMDSLILSMLNFDQSLFEHTFNRLMAEFSFRHIFIEVFVPLLHKIGIKWQSESITPAHEHFISNLIKQKLQIGIERVQQTVPTNSKSVYVLFLPDNEMHDLGLLYLNYELLINGSQTVFLGSSVPISSLKSLLPIFDSIRFISYFTVRPTPKELETYLKRFKEEILNNSDHSLWVTGKNVIDIQSKHKGVELFNDLGLILNKI